MISRRKGEEYEMEACPSFTRYPWRSELFKKEASMISISAELTCPCGAKGSWQVTENMSGTLEIYQKMFHDSHRRCLELQTPNKPSETPAR